MRRYCMLLDLIDDEKLIQEYEEYHRKVWPEVINCMAEAGIVSMKIYRFGNRMSMMMEVDDSFTFERLDRINSSNDTVQKWEKLMWDYQQAIPGCQPGQKWVLAEQIFDSNDFN